MTERNSVWNDEKMRLAMGMLLRIGVIAAGVIVVFGGILFFIQHPKETIDYATFNGEPARLRHVHTIVKEAFEFRSRAVIQLGILVLIATPLARVIFSLLGFIMEKDRVYIIITFIVLIILLGSLLSNYISF